MSNVPNFPTEVYPNLWVGPHPTDTLPLLVVGYFDLLVLTAFQYQEKPLFMECPAIKCPLTDDAFLIIKGDKERCEIVAEAVASWMRNYPDGKVLITCSAGQNRSSWVAGKTMILLGEKPDDVVKILEQKRKFANWFFKQDLLGNDQ